MKKAIFRGSLKKLKNLITFLFFVIFSTVAIPASFDCNRNIALSHIEKMICENKELSEVDKKLGEVYKKALAISTNDQSLKAEQKVWLRTKRDLCSNISCLLEAYNIRLIDFYRKSIANNRAKIDKLAIKTADIKEFEQITDAAEVIADKDTELDRLAKEAADDKGFEPITAIDAGTNTRFSFWQIALMIVVGSWFLKTTNRAIKNSEKRRKQEQAENAARLAQEEFQRTQRAIARAQSLSDIAGLVSKAQVSAAKLPLLISDTEFWLNQAENEFSEGVYSPFWEAMERAVQSLSEFDKTIRFIETAQQRHALEAPALAPDAAIFSLGLRVLPNPSATNRRMKDLYRKAQKDPHFAQIYEQRRTNAILIEGFSSLGDALNYLGDLIESEIRLLGDQLSFRLGDIELSLSESSKQMQRQHEELLQTAQLWREEARNGNAELATIAQTNAESAERGAKERRDMLDNIQHRRKP